MKTEESETQKFASCYGFYGEYLNSLILENWKIKYLINKRSLNIHEITKQLFGKEQLKWANKKEGNQSRPLFFVY